MVLVMSEKREALEQKKNVKNKKELFTCKNRWFRKKKKKKERYKNKNESVVKKLS